jgi:hypothetical protein
LKERNQNENFKPGIGTTQKKEMPNEKKSDTPSQKTTH